MEVKEFRLCTKVVEYQEEGFNIKEQKVTRDASNIDEPTFARKIIIGISGKAWVVWAT